MIVIASRCLCIFALLNAALASAADSYPASSLRIIVPYGPASGPDSIARRVGERLSEQMTIPVVVENREGAGGQIGAQAIASAQPNGATIGIIVSPGFFSVPAMQRRPAYDPIGDFTPIARVGNSPLMLVSSARASFSNWEELRVQVQRNPGKLTYAATGTGSATHLIMESFKLATGLNIEFVPYKSTNQQSVDLIGGHVDLNVTSLGGSMPQVRAGQVRAIAVGSLKRSPLLPDVPTFAEAAGKPDLDATVWYGFVGPKGMPDSPVARLVDEIQRAIRANSVKSVFDTTGIDAAFEGPAEFSQTIRQGATEARRLLDHLKLGATQ